MWCRGDDSACFPATGPGRLAVTMLNMNSSVYRSTLKSDVRLTAKAKAFEIIRRIPSNAVKAFIDITYNYKRKDSDYYQQGRKEGGLNNVAR